MKQVQRPIQGRPRTTAILRKAQADQTFRRLETDHWLSQPVTVKLDPNKPGTRDHAPYTMGCKRTKVKMSWFKDADGCFFASIPDAVALESRGYESRRQPWRFRVRNNILSYENDAKNRCFPVLQCVERDGYATIEWLIDPGDKPDVYDHAIDFLGLDPIDPNAFGKIAAERRSLFNCLRSSQRKIMRKAARKMQSRPGKRERAALRAEQNSAGQPKQTFKLY